MPVCGAREGSGDPMWQSARGEASWVYLAAGPVLSPLLQTPALAHPHKLGWPLKPGVPHWRSPCPALLTAVVVRWSCWGPCGTAPGRNSACCTCHRVPLKLWF